MTPAEPSRQTWALRLALGLALALLFWSFVGGAAYLASVRREAPLEVGPLDEARRRAGRGDVAGAAREYRMYSRLRPLDASGFVEMGNLLFRARRLEEAGGAFESALALRAGDAALLSRLGNVRAAQGRFAEAAAFYRRALEQSPLDAGLHNDLGMTYALDGHLDAAVAEFRAALAISPLKEAQANLQRALADQARSGRP